MTRILIRGGRVLDPSCDRDETIDLLLDEGRVASLGKNLRVDDADVVDASGCWVAPGFVDLHSHLREPGQEYKEDIASGGRSAVAGGFTAVACMANTQPVNDDPATTDFIIDRARQDSPARVYPVAAATKGLEGRVMTEMS
ncbi:MAG: dihydroorotase, partial [Myxococcales bacterium]